MKLFEEIERSYQGPALYSESTFDYLNRSLRPEADRVRTILEQWFSHYPVSNKRELRKRFCSNIKAQNQGAFFELFLHELLLKLECCIEIHKKPQNHSNKQPDFFVESNLSSFYLEAVVATGKSKVENAAELRMNQVYDVLNTMESPDFFIGMKLEGSPNTPPPARQIRSFLQKKLVSLDFDEMLKIEKARGLEALPHWPYQYDGWKIIFFPIPKNKARGRVGVRPIGMQTEEGHFIDAVTPLKDAILRKAGRYGNFELPYVVAVNAVGEHVDRIDIMEALFGKEQFIFNIDQSHSEPKRSRIPDGVWTSSLGPRYKRVSAVLITTVLPWNLSSADICLYHNPWATFKYNSELVRLPQALAENGKMKWLEGLSVGKIFGLS